MSSVEDEVREIKARIELAQRNAARAEADKDRARAAADEALSKLTSEYGVSTVEEAKAKMAEFQAELASRISQTRQALDELNL